MWSNGGSADAENEFLFSVLFGLVPGWVNDLPFHWVLKSGHMSSPTLCLLTTVSCSVPSIFPQNLWVTMPVVGGFLKPTSQQEIIWPSVPGAQTWAPFHTIRSTSFGLFNQASQISVKFAPVLNLFLSVFFMFIVL